MAEVARRNSGSPAEDRTSRSFGRLLQWHIDNDTRPAPVAGKAWEAWALKRFAGAAGVSDRTLRFWRNDELLPSEDHRETIERLLFGNEAALDDFRREFRAAYRRAKAVLESAHSDDESDEPAAPPGSEIIPPDRCIGRDEQVTELVAALTGKRPAACLVLGGPGMGKTTLTLEAAARLEVAAAFGARRWLVKLETARDTAAMQQEIVAAVGLNPAASRFEHALAQLGAAPALLILDNLETPWEGEPQPVEASLRRIAALPGLALLASVRGREAPHAPRWTWRTRVEPLAEPDARTLFRDIAPNIAADDADLGDFLHALGGIPLAIELVAYRAANHDTLAELWREWRRLGAALAARPDADPSRLTSLPHSIAQLTKGAERAEHVRAAREAWASIDRPDLVARLDALA